MKGAQYVYLSYTYCMKEEYERQDLSQSLLMVIEYNSDLFVIMLFFSF